MRASPAPGCAHSKTQSVRLIAETLDPGQTWRVSSEQNARYGTAPRSSCSLPTAVIQIEGGTHWAGHMLPGTSWVLRCSDAGHSGASRHQIRGVPGAPRRHANRSEAKTAARFRLRPLRMGSLGMAAWVLALGLPGLPQPLREPVGGLRAPPVRQIHAHVVALIAHPQLRVACLLCHPDCVLPGNQAVALAEDHD